MCPPLMDPPDGTVVVSGVTIGSNAAYLCDSGFTLSGSGLRLCESGGVWSGSEPLCEGGITW